MARHRYECSLRWSDMDAYGHVNNVVFLTYLEEARVDMLFVNAGSDAATEKLASGIVVARHEIDYTAPLVFRPEPVPIDVWVERLGNASFTLGYEVRDDAGPVYVRASSVMVPYDVQAGRPRRVSDVEREALQRFLVTT
ncbi:MAG: thioesterase family protein [Actinomycetes bacterium]